MEILLLAGYKGFPKDLAIVYWGYMGIMEKKMETAIVFMGVI